MRAYFRQARAIYRLTVLFDEVPRAKSIWSRLLGARRSPLSTAEFTVVDGRISLRQPDSVEDPKVMFRLFELVARHNLKLTAETENAVEAALAANPKVDFHESGSVGVLPQDSGLALRRVLAARDAPARTCWMLLFKEFQAIDSLVIRDYYHRYTVDEHSLVTIENLHSLAVEKAAIWTAGSATFFPRWSTRNCFIFRCCFTTSARACPSRATWKAAWKR